MNDTNSSFYTRQAEQLCHQYDQLSFKDVHNEWLNLLPKQGQVLDIGAGSGRDARYLAAAGFQVVAVEPSTGMREFAQQHSQNRSITWLDDRLPDLPEVRKLGLRFDLILLSAVWMHIPPAKRRRTVAALCDLLAEQGKIVISLRHGRCSDERQMYEVTSDELSALADEFQLGFELLEQATDDKLGRNDVTWQTVVLVSPKKA